MTLWTAKFGKRGFSGYSGRQGPSIIRVERKSSFVRFERKHLFRYKPEEYMTVASLWRQFRRAH